jgi:hypothetical protein
MNIHEISFCDFSSDGWKDEVLFPCMNIHEISFCDFSSDGWRDEVLLTKMDKKS